MCVIQNDMGVRN